MENKDLYETIFKRKSIRNYDLTPLDQNTLNDISNYLDNLKPLYHDIKTKLKIISETDVKRRFMKKAPHYIAVFSENKEGYLTNVGFMLQQMDLLLSASGIGTCWQGIPKPKKEVLESNDLEFVILMAFGKPNEALYRTSLSQFKRKPLHEMSKVQGADELVEAARLAPSATNSQAWFFTGNKNMIHVYALKPSFIKGLLTKKYIPIDVGIALYHLKLAAEHFGNETEIISNETGKNNTSKNRRFFGFRKCEAFSSTPEGYTYIASLKLKLKK